jgi:lipopolysaccharide exporter
VLDLITLFKDLVKRRFVRDVSMLGTGAIAAHGLALLASPILSRIYTPESFGVLAIFTAVAYLIGATASLRYELPVVLARSTSAAAALVHVCILIAVTVSVAVVLVVYQWGDAIAILVDASELAPLLYWLPIYVLAMGAFLPMSQWACRRRQFALLAQNPVLNHGTAVGVQLAAGALALGATGLVMGFLVGQLTATITLAARLLRKDWHFLRPRRGTPRRMTAVLRRFRRFPQYSAPQNIFNALSQQVPPFVLAFFFGPATAGLYWLTVRVLNAPGVLVGQAVRQVFYQRVSRIYNEGGSVTGPLLKLTLALTAMGMLVFLPVMLFGPALFAFVFGEAWREAGFYARWIAVWTLAGLANIPSVCSIQALGLQRQLLIWELLLFVGRGGALLMLAFLSTPLAAIAAYACVGAAFNTALIVYAVRSATAPRSHRIVN